MKILTITLHSLQNPGSVLQAYALQSFLIESGYDTQIIDYRPAYVSTEGSQIKALAKKILYFLPLARRTKEFNSFIEKHLQLTTSRYTSFGELAANPPKADCYITGSDQLWNSSYDCGRDKAYYLGFVREGSKLSYAVSVGKADIPKQELDWICENAKDFNWISVREGSSKSQLEKRGFSNLAHVCDPVLLVDRKKYMDLKADNKLEKYIAVYLVKESDLLDELIVELKKKFGYKIVLMGGFTKRCKCDLHIKDMGPKEFLGLLEGAEFIVASSFHATVFAHIFQKNFATILPKGNSARIEQFLKIANTENKIIRKTDDIPKVLESIDYEKDVTPRIKAFVNESKEGFLQILQQLECANASD